MNRGHGGEKIFLDKNKKGIFLDYLEKAQKHTKIKILAYCVMDNHYHLVIQNTSGKMSDFVKRLNGDFGRYYAKISKRKGYVFQSRFNSTLIEDDYYLNNSIIYLLQNPVRAGIVPKPEYYKWSSVNLYHPSTKSEIVDIKFVKEIFGSEKQFLEKLHMVSHNKLPIKNTKYGNFFGSDKFFKSALNKFNRRKKPLEQNKGVKRKDDFFFESMEKVIWEFEKKKRIKIDKIDISTIKGKRLRGELLLLLKDKTGLTYSEIGVFDIFSDLNSNSLRSIYRNTKKRLNY